MVVYTHANVDFSRNGERLNFRPDYCNGRLTHEVGASPRALQLSREAPSHRPPSLHPETGFTNNVVGAGSRKAHPVLPKASRRKRLRVAVDVDEGELALSVAHYDVLR